MSVGLFGPIFATVTLDASGSGTVRFQATDKSLRITNMAVRCSTAVKESIATVYLNQVGSLYQISASFSGSSGDNNADVIDLVQGQAVYVVWTGGDVGAVATATISGFSDVPAGGFRAVG